MLQTKKVVLNYFFQYMSKVYFAIKEGNIRLRKATEKLGAVQYKKVSHDTLVFILYKKDYIVRRF